MATILFRQSYQCVSAQFTFTPKIWQNRTLRLRDTGSTFLLQVHFLLQIVKRRRFACNVLVLSASRCWVWLVDGAIKAALGLPCYSPFRPRARLALCFCVNSVCSCGRELWASTGGKRYTTQVVITPVQARARTKRRCVVQKVNFKFL
jgi:hypothetical protein